MPPKAARAGNKEKEKENDALFNFQGRSLKNRTDDRFESILADYQCGPIEARSKGEAWSRAHKAHAEMRLALVKRGAWRGPDQEPRLPAPSPLSLRPSSRASETTTGLPAAPAGHAGSVAAAAAAFFPGDWWRALSAEPLAALVVDALANAFCDALLDACVLTIEGEEAPASLLEVLATTGGGGGGVPAASSSSAPGAACSQQRALTPSGSAPQLTSPSPHRQLSAFDESPGGSGGKWTSPSRGKDRARRMANGGGSGSAGEDELGSLAQLSRSSSDSWTAGRFHACKPLDAYTKRIEQAAAMQRPRRRVVAKVEEVVDHRKFVWPMSATNFPKEYGEQTKRQPVRKGRGQEQVQTKDDEHWLLDIGRDGKTSFPYSLALHKAFLESQPNPVLKEKAYKVAPLRMTDIGR